MSVMIDALLLSWDRNLDYAKRLLADVPDERMAIQPAAGMNHPAWTFSHLNGYHAIMVALIQGRPFEDPRTHKFGMQSKPEADRSIYASKRELLEAYARGHQEVAQALRAAGPKRLEEPTPLERWRNGGMTHIGVVLAYTMLTHESTHLGQVSAWRRVLGMPSV